MIKISFPNMGNSWVAFKALLESVPGVQCILPPPVTRTTIEIGSKYSPEFVCFPFKINLGDFILTYEEYNVDLFITALDCGPCRFGFYHAVQDRILKDLGYDFKIIAIDQADLLEFKWVDALNEIIPEENFIVKIFNATSAAINFFRKAQLIEDLENLESYFRCREINKGDTTKLAKKLVNILVEINDKEGLLRFRRSMIREFESIPIKKDFKPLKIWLTGEIHVTLEPSVNLDIKRKLGEMGIEVHMSLSLLDWVLHKFQVNSHRKELERIARPFLKMDIGGEAIWVIGEYLQAIVKGLDGFIHIYPFTCMPEVTARSIITKMDEPKIPMMFFSFDEHTGTEGMKTRLEAFVDLMTNRREMDSNLKPILKYQDEPSILDKVRKDRGLFFIDLKEGMDFMMKILPKIKPHDLFRAIFSST